MPCQMTSLITVESYTQWDFLTPLQLQHLEAGISQLQDQRWTCWQRTASSTPWEEEQPDFCTIFGRLPPKPAVRQPRQNGSQPALQLTKIPALCFVPYPSDVQVQQPHRQTCSVSAFHTLQVISSLSLQFSEVITVTGLLHGGHKWCPKNPDSCNKEPFRETTRIVSTPRHIWTKGFLPALWWRRVLRQNSNLLRQKASKNGLIFCNAHKDHSL